MGDMWEPIFAGDGFVLVSYTNVVRVFGQEPGTTVIQLELIFNDRLEEDWTR